VFSSIPDELKPPEPKVSRAYTILGFHEFEILDDKRVKYTSAI